MSVQLDDISFDAILQDRHVEIYKKPKPTPREAYVSQDDGLMDASKCFDGFEFDYDS